MPDKSSTRSANLPSLATTVFTLMLIVFTSAISVAFYVVYDRMSESSERALSEAADVRGRGLAAAFLGSLHRTWSELQFVAGLMSAPGGQDGVADKLQSLTEFNGAVSWSAFAGLDGIVDHASGRLLEGESVASQPWFAQGLEGPVATYGSTLERTAADSAPSGAPPRGLDLAVPVLGPARQVRGVLVAEIDFPSVKRYFRELAEALEIEAFLVSNTGEIVIAPEGLENENLDLPSIRAARVGVTRPFMETWPGGERYMMTVRSQIAYQDLPSFGWSLVVRVPAGDAGLDDETLKKLAIVAGAVLLFVLVVTFIYVRLYVRPAVLLAESATAVADGEDVYPYETRRTREYAAIAAAIAVLQGLARR